MREQFSYLVLGAGLALCLGAVASHTSTQDTPQPPGTQTATDPIVLTDTSGRPRIRIGINEAGDAVVETLDTRGTARAAISTSATGTGSLDIYDTQGRPRIAAFTFTDNEAGFQILDPDGTLRCSAVTSPTGQHWLRQFDSRGRIRIASGGPKNGNCSTYFFDESGIPRLSTGTTVAGEAFIELSDSTRTPRARISTTPGNHLVTTIKENDPAD